MKALKESKAMEEVRAWKQACNDEVADLSDDEALAKMIELAISDAREVAARNATQRTSNPTTGGS